MTLFELDLLGREKDRLVYADKKILPNNSENHGIVRVFQGVENLENVQNHLKLENFTNPIVILAVNSQLKSPGTFSQIF